MRCAACDHDLPDLEVPRCSCGWRPPPRGFVGRTREMAEVDAALEEARHGRGRLFLVVGEPGIGKTRLATEIAEVGRHRGVDVLWGRCSDAPDTPGYWPWIQILRAHLRTRDTTPDVLRGTFGAGAVHVADLLPELRERLGPLERPVATAPDGARFHLFDAITRWLTTDAAARPLVVVFDDLHVADRSSLLLLRFLAGELRRAHIVVVATYRPLETPRAPEEVSLLGDLARDGTTLPLGGLDRHEVALIIEHLSAREAPAGLAAAVQAATAGNPFFVHEVVRLLAAHGSLARPLGAGTLAVPAGVRAVIRSRLASLPAPCSAVLAAAAVLGYEFDVACLHAVAGEARQGLVDALDATRRVGLLVPVPHALGRYRFSHQLVRDAVYEELPERERLDLHARACTALERIHAGASDAHVVALAHHAAEAALRGEADRAVRYCAQAGERAAALLAYDEAADHYERALGALALDPESDERRRCTLLLGVGENRMRAGDTVRARTPLLEAAALARSLGDGPALARAGLALGGPWVEIGSVDGELVTILEDALAALEERDDPLRAHVMARLARELYWSGTPRRQRTLAAAALRIARRTRDPTTLAAALTARAYTLWGPDGLEKRLAVETEIVRLAEASGDDEMRLRAHLWRVSDFLELGDLAATDREIQAYDVLAETVRQPAYRWYAPRNRAMRALLAGRFDDGERLAAEALDIGTRAHRGLAAQATAVLSIVLRWERGALTEILDVLPTWVERYPAVVAWRCALAFVCAESGRDAEAHRALEPLAAGGFATIPRDATWLLAVTLLAQTCAQLGDARRAALLYERLRPFAARNVVVGRALVCLGSAAHHLGLLAATMGRFRDAEEHFEQALAMHARLGAEPWIARSRYHYAAMLFARGDARDRACRLASQAHETAEALSMQALAARAAALLDGAAAPAPVRPQVARLEREGEYWTVAAAGGVFRLRATRGLDYLAHLLRHPHRAFAVLELVTLARGLAPTEMPSAAAERPTVHVRGPGDAGEVIDAEARRTYRRRLLALRADLDEAAADNDPGRVLRLRHEIEALEGELARALGLGGRARRAGSPVEQARVNVTKVLRTTIRRIAAHDPSLGLHLERAVSTGGTCVYAPAEPLAWTVR